MRFTIPQHPVMIFQPMNIHRICVRISAYFVILSHIHASCVRQSAHFPRVCACGKPFCAWMRCIGHYSWLSTLSTGLSTEKRLCALSSARFGHANVNSPENQPKLSTGKRRRYPMPCPHEHGFALREPVTHHPRNCINGGTPVPRTHCPKRTKAPRPDGRGAGVLGIDQRFSRVASVSLSKKCRRLVSSATTVSSPMRVLVRGSTRAMMFSSLPEVVKYR